MQRVHCRGPPAYMCSVSSYQNETKGTQVVKVSFAGANFSVIDDGTYEAELEKHKTVPHPKDDPKGSPYVALTFIITEDGEYVKRRLWRNYSLKPEALWALKETMINLGASPDVFEGDEVDIDEELTNLYGEGCRVDVGVSEYQGKPRNEVRKVLAL